MQSQTSLLSAIVFVIMVWVSLPHAMSQEPAISAIHLKTEYLTNPIGIDQMWPRLSWIIESDLRNTYQTQYQVQVSTDPEFASTRSFSWNSGMVSTDQSIQVVYEGAELKSATRYYWRVKIVDNHGNESNWSDVAWWETGLLRPSDWKAKWIQTPWEEDKTKPQPVGMLRTEFRLRNNIKSARVYASAMGLYEMEINGKKVGDQLFTPGWTSYNQRVQYQTFDITDLLTGGRNAIGVYLGDGWYRGFIGWGTQRNYYGESLAFLGQIVVTYTNGNTEIIATDQNWLSATGPVQYSDIYKGEEYDARLEKEGWSQTGFNDASWKKVKTTTFDNVELIAPQSPPVRKIQELSPVSVFITPAGDTVIDFGQNLVGHMRIKVIGSEGTRITLRHAETLDKDGNFYTENLRTADQINTYTCKGGGKEEVWEPRFSFQGFRYAAVHGFPGNIYEPDAFTAVVIHSDMEPTAHFDCSETMVNQLQHNIVWGQKGNFLDVPTDCPQRDERMGWTGDIQVFANTANINMNTAGFLTRWMDDLRADQLESGAVTHVVPNVLGPGAGGAAGWGDAVAIVPWSLYHSFADQRILEQNYESIKKWINYIQVRASQKGDPYIWTGDYHFGDWLSFSTISRADYPGAHTHTDLIATAFFAHSTKLLAEMAGLLGKYEDVATYNTLLENIKTSFQNEFVTPNGRLTSDTQTAYLLALQFHLIPENLRQNAAQYLVNDIRSHGHLTTGFLGTPHLNHVLSEFGYYPDAYNLLLRKDFPSWLYPVTKGATTIWERWDGIKTDGSFQSEGMNSLNHYAYGAIGEWLYREVAGIQNKLPGYRSIAIQPNPGGGFKHSRAWQESPYGKIASAWEFKNDQFHLTVNIPANTSATIMLPFAQAETVLMDDVLLSNHTDHFTYSQMNDKISIETGSGNYTFSYPIDSFPDWAKPTITSPTADFIATEESLMAELLTIPETREILFMEIPNLMNSPWLSQVMNFTIVKALNDLPDILSIDQEKQNDILRKLGIDRP